MATLQELLELQGGQQQAIPTEQPNRSIGEWIGDTGISALNAAIGVPKAIGGLGQLMPVVNKLADPFVAGLEGLQESLYKYQSPQAQAARQEMLGAAREGRIMDAAESALTNPSNLLDLAGSGVASLGGMKLLGMGAGALAGGASRLSPYAQKFMGMPDWKIAGALEGLYTAGASANAFVDPEQFYNPGRLAAIPLGAVTGAIGGASAKMFPGGDIEARLLGGAAAPQASTVTGSLVNRMMADPRMYVRAPMQGAKEAGEEFFQSTQEAMWPQAVMEGGVNMNQALAEGVLGAIPGAMIGGAYGTRNYTPTAQEQAIPEGKFGEEFASWTQPPASFGALSPDITANNARWRTLTPEQQMAALQALYATPATPTAPAFGAVTSYADLMANRQPRTLTTGDYILREQLANEAAQREAERQQFGVAIGGKGYTGAKTPAQGSMVIPAAPPGTTIESLIAEYQQAPSTAGRKRLEALGVTIPEQIEGIPQQRPVYTDITRGMYEQQALPFEFAPTARGQELEQVNAARAALANRQAAPEVGQGEQFDLINAIDQATQDMSEQEARSFLEDFRQKETQRLIASGVNKIQATQYANTIVGRAQEQWAAKRAPLLEQQKAAKGALGEAQGALADFNQQLAGEAAAAPGVNRTPFARKRRGQATPIPGTAEQWAQRGQLSAAEQAAQTTVDELSAKLTELNAKKPPAQITGEAETLNNRVTNEANRLTQAKRAIDASVRTLAKQLETTVPEIAGIKNITERAKAAKDAAVAQLNQNGELDGYSYTKLLEAERTPGKSVFEEAKKIAKRNVTAQEKAAAAYQPPAVGTPEDQAALAARRGVEKTLGMQEGKARAAQEATKAKVLERAAQGETMPTTPMKGTWADKYKADLAAKKAAPPAEEEPTPPKGKTPEVKSKGKGKKKDAVVTEEEETGTTTTERTPEEREELFKKSKTSLSKASFDEVALAYGEIDNEEYGDQFKDIVIDIVDKLYEGPRRVINHTKFTEELSKALKAAGIERTAEAKRKGKNKDKEASVVDDMAVLATMSTHMNKTEASKDIWSKIDDAVKLQIGRAVIAKFPNGDPKAPVTDKEFMDAFTSVMEKGIKGGFKGFEIAEDDTLESVSRKLARALGTPEPVITDDKTVSVLATLIDNPDADVEDGFKPLKEKIKELALATEEFEQDTLLTQLGIALELGPDPQGRIVVKTVRGKGANRTKADTEQDIIDLVSKDLDTELDGIKTIFQEIYALVENPAETIPAAQAASKGATIEAGFRAQTSPAIRFSIYNKLYKDDNLVPWMINDISWRVNTNQIQVGGAEDPVTRNTQLADEKAGRLTTRTQFGYIALGENVKNNKKHYDSVTKGAQTAVRQMQPKASTEHVAQEAKQYAALSFVLDEIIRSNPSPFMKRLSGVLMRVLYDTGMMYRIKVSYKPHTANKTMMAEYVFVTNGVNPGTDLHEIRVYGQDVLVATGGKNITVNRVMARAFLHEVIHAITAAYVSKNDTSAETKIFQQLREIKAVNKALEDMYPDWNKYNDLRKTLEFIAAGLTDRKIAELLKSIQLTADNEHKGIFTAINALVKEPGKTLISTYKGFVKVVRSLFGIRRQDDAELTNAFDAFLNNFTTVASAAAQAAAAEESAGRAAYRAMAPDLAKAGGTLTSPNPAADALEAEYFQQKAEEEAAIQKQIWEDKQKEKLPSATGLRPSQERAITEGKSPAADIAQRDIDSLRKRDGYAAVDKLSKFLLSWIPHSFEKYAGPDGAYLKAKLHELVDAKPTLARVVSGLVDGYGIPYKFKNNMFNKTRRLNMINNLVSQIVNNPNLSFDEKLQQEFYDYLAGKTNTISNRTLMRLAKEFKQTIDEAKELGVLEDTLKNANYEDILSWNKSKMLENMRGFEFSSTRKGMVNIRNGHVEGGIDKFLDVLPRDDMSGIKVTAWWKKIPDANATGGSRIVHAFINAAAPYERQKQLIEDTYGAGYEQSPHTWYTINNEVAYRPFTFAERKAIDKNASFIRSIAFSMYGLERKITGIKLNDEMIAENKQLKNEEKFLFENTPENLAWLQEELKKRGSKNRILYYEQAQLDNEQKLMRTPGNWVVLKGTRWGALDNAKDNVSYIVPSTVFMAIEDYNKTNNIIDSKTLRFINRVWKKNMTVWSTTGHTTNVLSNFIICYYNDIHPQDIVKALKIIWRVKYRPQEATAEDWAFYEEAEARGAMLGTMASEELAETLENQINELEKLDIKGNSLTDYVKAATATSGVFLNYIRGIANKTDASLSDAYANEDNVFRLAAYISKVNQAVVAKGGATLTEAELESIGMWASEVMVNYNINAKYVKAARETVLPFIAWPYRMVGQLAKLAVEKPWKLANTIAVVYALDALAYAMLGASGDDDDEERKNLAPYMKESIWNTSVAPSYVRMPFGKLGEKGYFFGAGRVVPLGDLMVINDGMAVPQTLAAGGPVALMIQAMFNMDFFKRESIMKEGAPALDKMEDLVAFLWRGSAPAITTRAWDAFDKVISGKQGPLGSEATSYVEIARLLGLNVREVDFAEARYNKSIADRNALQKIKSYARRKIGQELRYPVPDMQDIQSINEAMFGALNDFWSTR